VTNYAPAYRVGAFAALHEREGVVFALIGGAVRHGGEIGGAVRHGGGTGPAGPSGPAGAAEPRDALPFPVLRPSQRAVARLAASGRFRAVVAGLSGRVAPLAAYGGARRAGVSFVLWATLWAHPRTAAHALSYLPVRHLYRHADAIVTYGAHVSAYVRGKGARQTVVEAPQSVDNEFWSAPAEPVRHAPFQAMFAGRLAREKGLRVLFQAWNDTGLSAPSAALVLVGDGPFRARAVATGAALPAGPAGPAEMRNFYAGSDVVVMPSIPTRDFREPWGLVANEAFNRGVPVIATDAVGAAAGGLIQHERTGLVVPAGNAGALAGALRRLHGDPALRERLGAAGRAAVKEYTHAAWAGGVSRALAAVGVSRAH
jgi:glycosyltransferase involved in cell wall biosynthesis